MSKILVSLVVATIARDAMTILPTTVPAHEVEVLKTIFGEDNVTVSEGEQAGVTELDTATESERLVGKYGPDALEKTHGKNFAGAIVRACKEFAVEAADAGADTPALDSMTKAQLLEEAEKRGVKVDASMTKAQLLEAIGA